MVLLKDGDRLHYNRDEREIRQLQVGRGLHRRQVNKNGEGLYDAVASAGRWVSDNKKVINDVVDTVGTVVKTGIQVKKELEDLERVKALRKAQENSLRPISSNAMTPTSSTPVKKDDVFSNLRLQAEQIKKGKGKKGNGLFLS